MSQTPLPGNEACGPRKGRGISKEQRTGFGLASAGILGDALVGAMQSLHCLPNVACFLPSGHVEDSSPGPLLGGQGYMTNSGQQAVSGSDRSLLGLSCQDKTMRCSFPLGMVTQN